MTRTPRVGLHNQSHRCLWLIGIYVDKLRVVVAVLRGPLLFALPLEEHYVVTGTHSQAFKTGTSKDFDVTTNTPWNWALQVTSNVTKGGAIDASAFRYEPPSTAGAHGWSTHSPPFGSGSAGVTTGRIVGRARRVKKWLPDLTYEHTAAEPPQSPVCVGGGAECGELEEVVLVPYGSTRLRMGLLPWF